MPDTIDVELSEETYRRYLDVKSRVDSGQAPDWYLDDFWDVPMSDVEVDKRWEVVE